MLQRNEGLNVIELDRSVLEGAGLNDLSDHHASLLLRQIYETLEFRVGATLAGRLSDEQLKEFEALIDQGEDESSAAWLEANVKDYREVTQALFAQLKQEMHESAEGIRKVFLEYDISQNSKQTDEAASDE